MKNKKLFAILTLVCFMFTLMPVAAFAAEAVVDQSAFVRIDTADVVNANEADVAKKATFYFNGKAATGAVDPTATLDFYVWAVDTNGNVSSALTGIAGDATVKTSKQYPGAFKIEGAVTGDKFTLDFARKGTYTIYAGVVSGNSNANLANAQLLGGSAANFDTVTVIGKATEPEEMYRAHVSDYSNKLTYVPTEGALMLNGIAGVATDGETMGTVYVTPNNVSEVVTVKLTQSGNAISDIVKAWQTTQTVISDSYLAADLAGMPVNVSTDSANIQLDKEQYKANVLGEIDLKLSASREGNYTIYLEANGVEFALAVNAGNTSAAYIETTEEPDALVALWENTVDVEFTITDINGNMVKNANAANNGADQIFDQNPKYLFFTEKPAASSLTNSNLSLKSNNDGTYNLVIGTLDAEGVYAVKVILDNGAFATAKWEVKKFQTPVELKIDAPATVELGTLISPELYYVDVNGVEKAAKDAKLAATGYAIYSFVGNDVQVKDDEKYAGSVVTLTAASERYDLVATKAITVAAEAVAIEFAKDALAVNVNNKVVWNVVDAEGNEVTLNDKYTLESVKYVVLDKPADAKVSVYDLTGTNFDGEGKMALTSNKVGNVTVQVIAQVQVKETAVANGVAQTKYYTGTQIFAVGTEGVGDVVVMSIGSNEIVKNDKVATMIAAPIVQNDRTFVPFRALAEAFGAEVAWDEATQAVTAELNGVTVVMTIGSVEYTINGEAATMDVAPFLGNDSTMVPVRFVAQAFGIKVIPTYDANGATADILFNL